METDDIGVLVSCEAEQFSFEDEKSERSLFTLVLEDALSGAADYDGDGDLTGAELFRHLDNGMGDYLLQNDRLESQTPTINDAGREMSFLRVDKVLLAKREEERLAEELKLAEMQRAAKELEEAEVRRERAKQSYETTMESGEAYFARGDYTSAEAAFNVALQTPGYANDTQALARSFDARIKQRETEEMLHNLERKRQEESARLLKAQALKVHQEEEERWVGFWRCDEKAEDCGGHLSINGLACYEIQRRTDGLYVIHRAPTIRKYSNTRDYWYPLAGAYKLSVNGDSASYRLPFESGLTDTITFHSNSSYHIVATQISQNAGANGAIMNWYRVDSL